MIEIKNIKSEKTFYICLFLTLIVLILAIMFIIISFHPLTIVWRLEIDNNTLKAVESINWSVLKYNQSFY